MDWIGRCRILHLYGNRKKMKDYIYYLYINGKIEPDFMFATEQEATDFAESRGIEGYYVIQWDVD